MRIASPGVGYGPKNFATQVVVVKANTEPVGSVAVFGWLVAAAAKRGLGMWKSGNRTRAGQTRDQLQHVVAEALLHLQRYV